MQANQRRKRSGGDRARQDTQQNSKRKQMVKKRAMKFAKKLHQLPLPDMKQKLAKLKQQKPKFGQLVHKILNKAMKNQGNKEQAENQQKALEKSKEYSGSPKNNLYKMISGLESDSEEVLSNHADDLIKNDDTEGPINERNTEADNYILQMASDFLENSEMEPSNDKDKDEQEKGEGETAYKKP